MEVHLAIHTDGSCLRNPDGPGGWSVIVCKDGAIMDEVSGGHPRTTNNRMELTAAIQAARYAISAGAARLMLHSDSNYVIRGINEWLPGWRRKNFFNVKNPDLWMEMATLLDQMSEKGVKSEFKWVRGHNGDPMNERADKLAKREAVALK